MCHLNEPVTEWVKLSNLECLAVCGLPARPINDGSFVIYYDNSDKQVTPTDEAELPYNLRKSEKDGRQCSRHLGSHEVS